MIFKYSQEAFEEKDIHYKDGKILYKGKRPLIAIHNVSGLELTFENGIAYENTEIFKKLDAFNTKDFPWSMTRYGPKLNKFTAFFDSDGQKIERRDITEEFTFSMLVEPQTIVDANHLSIIVHQIKINELRNLPNGCVMYHSLDEFKAHC